MRRVFPIVLLFISASYVPVEAITIELDYRFDAPNPFFDTQRKKDTLEAAAGFFESILMDDLDALPAGEGPGNTWVAKFFVPNEQTDIETELSLDVPADTLILFAGGRDLPGDELGRGTTGNSARNGAPEWTARVRTRGEPNALDFPPTDIAPWGGSLAFDTTNDDGRPRQWNFSVDDVPRANEYDFLSVALREIGRVLGIGTSLPWRFSGGNTGQFTGPASTAAFGEDHVPLDADKQHWAEGTVGTVLGSGEPQVAAMVRVLPAGTRRLFTDLDVAALSDIGWEIAAVDQPELQAGDADMDLDFDQLDIVRVQIAAKYLTGQPATWGEGDWDGAPGGAPGNPPAGNGLFDQLDIVAALTPNHYLSGPYASLRPKDGLEWTVAGNNHLTYVSVPEPSTVVLALLAALAFARIVHKHRVSCSLCFD